jgi:CcmD family protein
VNDYAFVIREFRFIFWAYNLIWIGLAAYLVYLLVRMNRLTREVRRLTEDSAAPPRS